VLSILLLTDLKLQRFSRTVLLLLFFSLFHVLFSAFLIMDAAGIISELKNKGKTITTFSKIPFNTVQIFLVSLLRRDELPGLPATLFILFLVSAITNNSKPTAATAKCSNVESIRPNSRK